MGEESSYITLLQSQEDTLEKLLSLMERQKLAEYKDEADFVRDLSKRETYCEEVRTISVLLDRCERRKGKSFPEETEAEERKERIRELIARVQEANEKSIADVNERLFFYRRKMEELRKAKTGMTAYLKSNLYLWGNRFDRIG